MWTIVNDRLMEADSPVLPVSSRAVSYGDGCFETLRSYAGRFLGWEPHLHRLHEAMQYLGMASGNIPESVQLRKHAIGLLKKNEFLNQDAVVRLQVWREGKRGYHTDPAADISWALQAAPLPGMTESVRLAEVPTRRVPAAALNPGFKLSNGLNYIRAAREAAERGAEDALMLTVGGFISETTIANLFWVKKDTIFTPSETCDILPGITRNIIMQLIHESDRYTLETGKFKPDHLKRAEAVWICNSLRELLPVSAVDERKYEMLHPVMNDLRTAFEHYKAQHLD